MIIDRENNNYPHPHNISDQKFVCLGSRITNSGRIEILRRPEMTKVVTRNLNKIWKDQRVTKKIKMRLVKLPIFLHASRSAKLFTP